MPAGKFRPVRISSFYHMLQHAISEANLVDQDELDEGV
jgi:hypothetical protein